MDECDDFKLSPDDINLLVSQYGSAGGSNLVAKKSSDKDSNKSDVDPSKEVVALLDSKRNQSVLIDSGS